MSTRQRQDSVRIRPAPLDPDNADPFDLYITAVQDPARTVDRCEAIYEQSYGKKPLVVREDFCGVAANCLAWIEADEGASLIGVDHDSMPLQWCRENLIPALLPSDQDRLQLLYSNVTEPDLPQADLILAMNSSFCALKKRTELLRYMKQCREALAGRGMLIMEVYAGPESQMTGNDIIQRDGFTATWEQESFNAVTNETITHLHFSFPDGREIRKAFSYDWRLWSPAELLEAMEEAGFSSAEVYPITDASDQPPSPCRSAEVRTHWTVYVCGWI